MLCSHTRVSLVVSDWLDHLVRLMRFGLLSMALENTSVMLVPPRVVPFDCFGRMLLAHLLVGSRGGGAVHIDSVALLTILRLVI